MTRLPILAFSFFLCSSFSLAGAELERTCRIIFPNRPKEVPGFVFLCDGVSSTKVRLSGMNFSEVISVSGNATTISLTPEEVAEANEIPREAPSILLPERIRDCYIILSTDKDSPLLPVSMRLVDVTGKDWKQGETLWINTSECPIDASLGEVEISIGVNEEVISSPPLKESGYYEAKFSFHPVDGAPAKPITEQHWWHDAKSRHLGYISGGTGMLPSILLYRDFRSAGESK